MQIVLKFDKNMDETRESSEETRVKTREKLLEIIKKKPSATTPEIAESLGLTIKGVAWNLKKLSLEGLIERVGAAKGGHWKLSV
ncbi:MAG: winged helix-turn-helix domain-containing protein [Fibromonadaceae bacterium]|jgi:ATP-dependent DNA helicase RecG|nr:winged helix-turn-helix domain-containing protein [Fibromonadaceae bacterium]